MPKPPAEFELHTMYKGEVVMKYLPNSHTYKIQDKKYNREWVTCPGVTSTTDKMEKGAGLMVYAMSEAMKHMDSIFHNKSLQKMVDDPKFTLPQLFKDARMAHKDKSALGRKVGTESHTYVEKLLKSFKRAQDRKTQFIVPEIPRATDIAGDLKQSWLNIIDMYSFKNMKEIDKYREIVNQDIEMRALIWNESLMVQRATEAAREFFVAAAKQGAIKVWTVEKFVHSRKLFISGRFDSIIEFLKPFVWRGYTIYPGIYIVDFKTSNPGTEYPMGIFPNHLPQTGLYDVAYCEEFPEMLNRIKGHLILGSSKHGDGFHPYASLKRKRNRDWGKALVPVMEYMHQGEQELKGLNLYAKS